MSKASKSLRVSQSGRFLEYPDGRPFFYLADTAWELFHRLSVDEAGVYLRDRAAKGFTVIQAVVLAELDGLRTPNPQGHTPLIDLDPTRPNEAYFLDVDTVVRQAADLGLIIGMLPTWGDKWHSKPDDVEKPGIFNPENAKTYGRFLGQRYRNSPIIWILGGDRLVTEPRHTATLNAMAAGLTEGDGGRHLKTFHPIGQYSSAMYFHDSPWLDFNMIQTGHSRDRDNFTGIAAEYARTPIKPVVDGEPGYENIPHGFDAVHGRLDAHQARKFCYWALFSGACGHTYGCNDIWQMWKTGDKPQIWADTPWDKALSFPGSGQMGHARRLIESGNYFDRVPDQSLIVPPNSTGPDYIAACRAPDSRWALLYLPMSRAVTIRLNQLLAARVNATWIDPRTGERKTGNEVPVSAWTLHTYTPPGNGDWILLLERTA
jgi:hypothetical protein